MIDFSTRIGYDISSSYVLNRKSEEFLSKGVLDELPDRRKYVSMRAGDSPTNFYVDYHG